MLEKIKAKLTRKVVITIAGAALLAALSAGGVPAPAIVAAKAALDAIAASVAADDAPNTLPPFTSDGGGK